MSADQTQALVAEYREKAAAVVAELLGVHPRLAAPVSVELCEQLQKVFAGQRPYFPAKQSDQDRKREINAAFNGRNHDQVCRQFKISRATLYRYLGERKC